MMLTTRTVMDLIKLSTDYLEKQGCENPRLDAEVLLASVLSMDRLHLYLNFDRPLEKEEVDAYRALIAFRSKRTPVSYLTGTKEFYSREFIVNNHVLIPRPETEILVAEAIVLANLLSTPRILDLGTGSGIIAITLALELERGCIVASDVSEQALQVAKENALALGISDHIEFVHSNLFDDISGYTFDIICANPPYIPTTSLAQLEPEVQKEPTLALDGGVDGLEYYRLIFKHASKHLWDQGYLILEIGSNQTKDVIALGQASEFCLYKTLLDYAGLDRVVVFQWRQ